MLPYGIGIFTASLVLAIMIIPYAASLGREMIRLVPSPLKEGAYALGAAGSALLFGLVGTAIHGRRSIGAGAIA